MNESESIDESEVVALDPKQYTQNRRLRQIHATREQLLEIDRQKHAEYVDQREKYREKEYRKDLAFATYQYGLELEPIIIKSDHEILNKEIPQNKVDGTAQVTIGDVLSSGGTVEKDMITRDSKFMSISSSRWLRRQLDQFLSKIGLGVDIEEDGPPMKI